MADWIDQNFWMLFGIIFGALGIANNVICGWAIYVMKNRSDMIRRQAELLDEYLRTEP